MQVSRCVHSTEKNGQAIKYQNCLMRLYNESGPQPVRVTNWCRNQCGEETGVATSAGNKLVSQPVRGTNWCRNQCGEQTGVATSAGNKRVSSEISDLLMFVRYFASRKKNKVLQLLF